MAAIQNQRRTTITITTSCRQSLSREASNLSNYEGYHGGETAPSVPFTWESEPGTPKVKFRRDASSLPPLTPPPSFSYRNPNNNRRSNSNSKAHKKPNSLFQTIFPTRLTARKSRADFSYPSPSSFSSSSSSSLSSPARLRSRSVPSSPIICPRRSLDRRYDDDREVEEEDLYGVPVSSLCFGNNARSRGCYSSIIKKMQLGDFL